MRVRSGRVVTTAGVLLGIATRVAVGGSVPSPSFAQFPNAFEAAGAGRFVSRTAAGDWEFTSRGASLALGAQRISFRTGEGQATAQLEDLLPGVTHHLVGPRSQWRTNVPTYGRLRYREVYRGVDLVYYGGAGSMEYDFELAAGADPARIQVHIEGARRLRINAAGDLVIQMRSGELVQQKPVAYQQIDGVRRDVEASYVLRGSRVSFRLDDYDRLQPLVIDPIVKYATFLGGNNSQIAFGAATDSAGNAYVTGFTNSTNFPTQFGVLRRTFGGGASDAFVAKVNPEGTALVWSTYLGGAGSDQAFSIAVDPSGNVYVTGSTESSDFPTTAGVVRSGIVGACGSANCSDAFVAKLNPTGSGLVYSTLLGGTSIDVGNSIGIDAVGDAFVAGYTNSPNFTVTPGSVQTNFGGGTNCAGGCNDAFVTKLNPTGTALLYSTFLGGTNIDRAYGIAVDAPGNAYVAGYTQSSTFPTTTGAYDRTFGGGTCTLQGAAAPCADTFAVKLNPTGSQLLYSTLVGGTGFDLGQNLSIDGQGNAYITGTTTGDFPVTPGAAQTIFGGMTDWFVTALNPTGSGLLASTYIGGRGADAASAVAAAPSGKIYVVGDFGPPGPFDPNPPVTASPAGNAREAVPTTTSGWIVELDAQFRAANPIYAVISNVFGSYAAVALFSSGDLLAAGAAAGSVTTTPGALQSTANTNAESAFVTKVDPNSPIPGIRITKSQSGIDHRLVDGDHFDYTITVTNTGNVPLHDVVIRDSLDPRLRASRISGLGCEVLEDISGAGLFEVADVISYFIDCDLIPVLAPGATVQVTVRVSVYALAYHEGDSDKGSWVVSTNPISNQARVSSREIPRTLSNTVSAAVDSSAVRRSYLYQTAKAKTGTLRDLLANDTGEVFISGGYIPPPGRAARTAAIGTPFLERVRCTDLGCTTVEELTLPPNSHAIGSAVLDADGDATADAVILTESTNGAPGALAVYLTGKDRAPVTTALTGTPVAMAAWTDRDGKPRLAIIFAGSLAVAILQRDAAGRFTMASTATLPVAGGAPSAIAARDLTGDGSADLVVANSGTNTVRVLRGDGAGNFTPGASYTVGANPVFALLTDFDGDQRADLATANNGDGTVSVLKANGDGTFAAPVSIAVGDKPTSITAIHLFGDALPELVVTAGSPGLLTVLGNTAGVFTAVDRLPVGGELNPVVAANLDAVGGQDLIVTSRLSGDFLFVFAAADRGGPALSGVVNGASFAPEIASNGWVTIRGSNLASTTRIWQGPDFIGNKLPVMLDGTSATINGKLAYVYFISPEQLNVLAPIDAATGNINVQVTTPQGTSAPLPVLKRDLSPAFFPFEPEGRRYAAATHADGSLLAKNNLFPGLATSGAKPGETIILYATGFGATTPPIEAGEIVTQAGLLPPVIIRIGGAVAQVAFAGLVSSGLYQFNVVTPDVPNGDQSLTAEIGGVMSPAGVFVTIQR